MLHLKISNPHLIPNAVVFLLRRRRSSNFISFHFHRRLYLEDQNINEASHLYQNAQRSSGSGTLANQTDNQHQLIQPQYPSPSPTARSNSTKSQVAARSTGVPEEQKQESGTWVEGELKENWRRRVKFAGTQLRICGKTRRTEGEGKAESSQVAIQYVQYTKY